MLKATEQMVQHSIFDCRKPVFNPRFKRMTPLIIRALVVEDDSSWQQILTEILEDSGILVDVASSLDDALKILKSESHRLAIVDLSLAGEDHHNYDGLRILEGVRRLDPGCKTILLTGYATVELAVSVLTEYGAFTFLRKENFQRSQFKEIINRALASAQPPGDSDDSNLNVIDETKSPNETMAEKPAENPVLVVEDDAGWRSIIAELLSDANHRVTLCASYGEALGYIRREKFVLAIIDLSLTGNAYWEDKGSGHQMEGFELLSHTKEKGIPTIVVSGIGTIDEIQRAYSERSIFAYLEKQTFDRNTFRCMVEEACKTNVIVSELEDLTEREKEVYELLAKGMTNKEIAETLVITTNTVKRHIKSIFEKLGVHTRSAATAKSVSGFKQS